MKSKVIRATLLLMPLLCGPLRSAINITSPAVPDPFTAIPTTDQWSTLKVGTATDAAITSNDAFDTKIKAATDASTITTLISNAATYPPNTGDIARRNDGTNTQGIAFLQTRPTGEDYILLLGHLQNATGGPINSVQISYEYSKATDTASETIKGLRAYWSMDGTPNSWNVIPELSVDTTGVYNAPQILSASVTLPSALANAGTMFILFADQNSSGTDASYHIRNFAVSPGLGVSLSASATPGVRSPGVSASDPLDDTVTFDLTVTGTGAVSPSGWKIVSPPTLAGITGAYGVAKNLANTPIALFTGGTLQIRIADADATAAETSVGARTPHVLATNAVNNTPILTSGVPPTGWVVDDAARTSNQNSSGQGDIVLNSEVIDLTAVGAVQFAADLDAIAGTSSGFETADSFGLELIIDGGAPVSVLGAADTDNSGRLIGMDGGTSPELPGATEFPLTRSFHFSRLIPDAANTLQIRIIGNSNSPSETYLVKNVTVGGATGGGDTDGDGVSDTDEGIMGTDPNNAADVLRLAQAAGNPSIIEFPSKNGKFYRGVSSSDLQTWTGSGTTIVGDGTVKQFSASVPGGSRMFDRIHVMATDGPWVP